MRAFLSAVATLEGYALDDLLSAIKPGRQTEEQKHRYDVLARAVADMRRGHRRIGRSYDGTSRAVTKWNGKRPSLELIGEALGGKGAQTVANLEARGRELHAEEVAASAPLPKVPCKKHAEYLEDCPACMSANDA
jgi:hypothetical protein